MIRGLEYSKSLLTAATVCLGSAAGMLPMKLATKATVIEHRLSAEATDEKLSAQIAANMEYSDAKLIALRGQVETLRRHLGEQRSWERIAGHLGKTWTLEPGRRTDKDGFSIQYGTFRLLDPRVSDWPEIVGAIKEIEETAGAGVVEFEMKASEGREPSTLKTVRILVALQTARALAEAGNR